MDCVLEREKKQKRLFVLCRLPRLGGEKGEGSGRAAESVDKGYMPERENRGTESPLVFS